MGMIVRAELLRTRTTREIEDDMSATDMDLLTTLYDLMRKQDDERTASAVNRGMWGEG